MKDTQVPVVEVKQNRVMASDGSSDSTSFSVPAERKSDSAEPMERGPSAVSHSAGSNRTRFDPSGALAKFDASAAILANLDRFDPSAALAKFDASAAILANLDVSAVLDNIAKIDPSAMLAGLAKNPMLGSLALSHELDDFFAEIPEAEILLKEASNALGLTVPFGYDRSVRTTLQILVMTSIFSTLFVAFLVNPFLGAALSALGTPNAVVTWKATGKAYDRLYGRENNHPDKALEKVNPSSKNQRHRHSPGDRISW